MFIDMNLEKMLNKIEFVKFGVYDIVINERHGEEQEGQWRETEEYYKRLLQELTLSKISMGVGAIGLALENAFIRGNENLSYKIVSVKIFEGIKGRIVRIRDSGEGFDYRKKIRELECCERYFVNIGNGLEALRHSKWLCSYEMDGSILNICILNEKR